MPILDSEKNQFAEENFNLIHYVAQGFRNTGISHDELVSIGSVGYTKAINTYNSKRGAKFSTYAVTCIRNEILHFLRQEKRYNKNTVPSSTLLYEDSNGNELHLEDTLSSEMVDKVTTEDPTLFMEDMKIIKDAIKRLSEREQFILIYRFGMYGRDIHTQERVGKKLGMSQANVSKLEHRILSKLFDILRGEIDIEKHEFYHSVDTSDSFTLDI